MKNHYLLIPLIILLAGCERIITLDLPDVEEQIVVEGGIETGLPPSLYLHAALAFMAIPTWMHCKTCMYAMLLLQ